MKSLKLSILLVLISLFVGSTNIRAAEELKAALLVIDVQKAFSDPEGFSPVCRAQADSMLPVINRLSQRFSKQNRDIIYIKQDYVRDTQFDSRLKIRSDFQFTKKNPNSFTNKDFESHLSTHNVKHLYVVGLAAEYCVSATVSAALQKGYKVTVVADAIAAKYCDSLPDELDSFKIKGATIAKSKDI